MLLSCVALAAVIVVGQGADADPSYAVPCPATKANWMFGCSDLLHWDPVPGATYYIIKRCTGPSTCREVGSTGIRRQTQRTKYLLGGIEREQTSQDPWWNILDDDSMQYANAMYTYYVKAARVLPGGEIQKSADWSAGIAWKGRVFTCYDDTTGREVQCFPGDVIETTTPRP